MDEIKITNGNEKYSFSINRIKYLYGGNYQKKFQMINLMKSAIYKISESEFQQENNLQIVMHFNERMIDHRNWNIIEINHFFDIENDLKIGSKSLALKYIEAKLSNIEYSDELHTINGLFKDFNDFQINEKIDAKDRVIVQNEFIDFGLKSIVKMMKLAIKKEELFANFTDLTYEETIFYQLNMLNDICENNIDKKYLVILDLPFYNHRMMTFINKLEYDNIYILCLCNHQCFDENIKNFYNFDKIALDFSNDIDLYNELLLNLPFSVTLEELKDLLKKYVNHDYDERISLMKDFL